MKYSDRLFQHILMVFGLYFWLTAMMACGGGGGGEEPAPEPEPQPKLEVKPDKVNAGLAGGAYTVDVTATSAWSASCDSVWCKVTTAAGVLTLNVAANPMQQERQTRVSVVMDKLSRTVVINQEAGKTPEPGDLLEVEREEIEVAYGAGKYKVAVTANIDWSVNSDQDWCTVVRDGDTVRMTVELNPEISERPAVIRVTGGSFTRTIRVTQTGITARGLDSLVLVAIAVGTDGENWKNSWNISQNLSSWPGVHLDASGERVEKLILRGNRLSGDFPVEIVKLSALKKLDLGNNNLKGNLPVDLTGLNGLEYLALDSCKFGGNLPDGLMQLTGLRILDLGYNAFVGNLPEGLSALTSLVWIRLAGNQFEGSLPETWKDLKALTVLDVSMNTITGNIPSIWFSSLHQIEYLYLYGNQLEGNIPEAVVHLYSLRSLAFDNNNLTGSIPGELGNLPDLIGLWLYNNYLTGQIPASLTQHSRWPEWQALVCPQRGAGFTDVYSSKIRSKAQYAYYPLPDKNCY